MEAVRGGITAPRGFLATGVSCGIKRRGKDLAMIVSDRPAVAAGVFTRHRFPAPCVSWVRACLKVASAQAIVANSGNANSCTGIRGDRDTERMARSAARELGIPARRVLVASTGVIGQALPLGKVLRGIRKAASGLSRTGSASAAEAIMTTDTRPKELAVRFGVKGRPVTTVGGIAKGSGMISPSLATMLAFLTTDAQVAPGLLRQILRDSVADSFNAITVDGQMSTNDMVLFLANGASGAPRIGPASPWARAFALAVGMVCRYLAREIVRDGEGVTRIFTVRVTGAATANHAQQVARQVANSPLVKTMVAGRDPNWGRIVAAVGAAGLAIPLRRLVIRLGRTVVFCRGEPSRATRAVLLKEVDKPEIEMGIVLGRGPGQAKILSGDLTEGYVRINAKYTT